MDKYPELKYVILAKFRNQAFYEAIAAFNSKGIATGYMNDCIRMNTPFVEYKLEEI